MGFSNGGATSIRTLVCYGLQFSICMYIRYRRQLTTGVKAILPKFNVQTMEEAEELKVEEKEVELVGLATYFIRVEKHQALNNL